MNQVVTVFPFGNTIMVKDIKGSDIVAALEHGVSDVKITGQALEVKKRTTYIDQADLDKALQNIAKAA